MTINREPQTRLRTLAVIAVVVFAFCAGVVALVNPILHKKADTVENLFHPNPTTTRQTEAPTAETTARAPTSTKATTSAKSTAKGSIVVKGVPKCPNGDLNEIDITITNTDVASHKFQIYRDGILIPLPGGKTTLTPHEKVTYPFSPSGPSGTRITVKQDGGQVFTQLFKDC